MKILQELLALREGNSRLKAAAAAWLAASGYDRDDNEGHALYDLGTDLGFFDGAELHDMSGLPGDATIGQVLDWVGRQDNDDWAAKLERAAAARA
jgi:hypothetical protein